MKTAEAVSDGPISTPEATTIPEQVVKKVHFDLPQVHHKPQPTRSGRERKPTIAVQEWKESGDKTANQLSSVLLCLGADGDVLECGLNLSVAESMREDSVATAKAVLNEIQQMIDFQVIGGIMPSKLIAQMKNERLPSKKEMGVKVLTKARLVGGGHRKVRIPFDDYSSPTVDLTTVKLNLALAAEDGANAETIDIKAAFLNASLPEKSKPVYMKLDKHV